MRPEMWRPNDHVEALMGARLALIDALDMLRFWGDYERIEAAIEHITREIGL